MFSKTNIKTFKSIKRNRKLVVKKSRNEIAYILNLHKPTVLSVHHFQEILFHANSEKYSSK